MRFSLLLNIYIIMINIFYLVLVKLLLIWDKFWISFLFLLAWFYFMYSISKTVLLWKSFTEATVSTCWLSSKECFAIADAFALLFLIMFLGFEQRLWRFIPRYVPTQSLQLIRIPQQFYYIFQFLDVILKRVFDCRSLVYVRLLF